MTHAQSVHGAFPTSLPPFPSHSNSSRPSSWQGAKEPEETRCWATRTRLNKLKVLREADCKEENSANESSKKKLCCHAIMNTFPESEGKHNKKGRKKVKQATVFLTAGRPFPPKDQHVSDTLPAHDCCQYLKVWLPWDCMAGEGGNIMKFLSIKICTAHTVHKNPTVNICPLPQYISPSRIRQCAGFYSGFQRCLLLQSRYLSFLNIPVISLRQHEGIEALSVILPQLLWRGQVIRRQRKDCGLAKAFPVGA